jgi:hypothetical protein
VSVDADVATTAESALMTLPRQDRTPCNALISRVRGTSRLGHGSPTPGWSACPASAQTRALTVAGLVSYRCMVPSSLAAARVRPDSENAMENTCPCGPVRVAMSVVPSVTPAASVVPARLNVTAQT